MASAPSSLQRPAQILTLVVWGVCAAAGTLGLVLHHPWPQAAAQAPEPVMAQVAVELPPPPPVPEVEPPAAPATETPPAKITLHPARPEAPAAAPPPLARAAQPEAPALTPVAAPSPAIAFAVPVAGPVRIAAKEEAAAGPGGGSPQGAVQGAAQGVPGGVPGGTGAAEAAPIAKQLIFGQGEGKQEKPDYPREALRRRQEGTVGLRFVVDDAGAVTEAEISEPCPHPLLNLAALETVKKQWRFPPGGNRVYRVSIRFQFFKP